VSAPPAAELAQCYRGSPFAAAPQHQQRELRRQRSADTSSGRQQQQTGQHRKQSQQTVGCRAARRRSADSSESAAAAARSSSTRTVRSHLICPSPAFVTCRGTGRVRWLAGYLSHPICPSRRSLGPAGGVGQGVDASVHRGVIKKPWSRDRSARSWPGGDERRRCSAPHAGSGTT